LVHDCIFCKIFEGKIPSKKIYGNDNFFSIFDVAPQVKGHALIISKKHFVNSLDIPNTLGSELFDCIKKTFLFLQKEFGLDGFNLVNNNFDSAGQIVEHFHVHLLPRKKGDGLSLSLR